MDGKEPDIPMYKVIKSLGPTNTRVYVVAVYFRGERLAKASGNQMRHSGQEPSIFLVISLLPLLYCNPSHNADSDSLGHSIQEAEMNAAERALSKAACRFPQLHHQRQIMEKTSRRQRSRH
jgi:ribonuclease-3